MRLGAPAFLVLLAACAGPEATSTCATPLSPYEVHSYVIARLDPSADAPGEAYGLDLDGMEGGPPGSCAAAPDRVSALSGAPGVDDALQDLVPTLDAALGGDGFEGLLDAEIMDGSYLVLIEVSDINSFTNDSSVMVRVALAEPLAAGICRSHRDEATCLADAIHGCGSTPEGTCTTTVHVVASETCAAHGDRAACEADEASPCWWSDVEGRCAGVAPDQALAVRDELGGMAVSAEIVTGILTVHVPELPLLQPTPAHPRGFARLHDVILRARITANSLVSGELGGAAPVPELVTWEEPGGPVASLADLDPSPTDPTECTALSVGLRFDAVAAAPIVDGCRP